MNQENMITSLTEEDKKLLLSELSGRLPYGVKFGTTDIKGIWTLSGILGDYVFPNCNTIEVTRPYLRPMSNMTEEEKHELLRFGTVSLDKDSNAIDVCCVGFWNHAKVQDYLNSIHVDYRGLIEKGLAIRVTPENNPYHE